MFYLKLFYFNDCSIHKRQCDGYLVHEVSCHNMKIVQHNNSSISVLTNSVFDIQQAQLCANLILAKMEQHAFLVILDLHTLVCVVQVTLEYTAKQVALVIQVPSARNIVKSFHILISIRYMQFSPNAGTSRLS